MASMNEYLSVSYRLMADDRFHNSMYDLHGDEMYNLFIVRDEAKGVFISFQDKQRFISFMEAKPEMERTFHEVIFGRNPQRVKFDVDISASLMAEDEVDALIRRLLSSIIDAFDAFFSIKLPMSQLLVFSSHRAASAGDETIEGKFSFHVVVMGYSLPSNKHVEVIANSVKERMGSWASHIDSVYKNIQSFRILGCTKTGEMRPKVISAMYGCGYCYLEESFIQFNTMDRLLSLEIAPMPINLEAGAIGEDQLAVINRMLPDLVPDSENFVLREVRGNVMNFNRLRPSYCSICGVVHDKENSMYLSLDGGSLRLHCRRQQDMRINSMRIYQFENSARKKSRAEILEETARRVKLVPSLMSMTKYWDMTERYESPLLREINDDEVITYIKAPMKLGKSKNLRRYIDGLAPDISICFISFRIAFSDSVLSSMPGFISYQDISGDIGKHVAPRVVVQVESLHRIKGDYDLVVLDESESILSQFDSDNLSSKSLTIAKFRHLLRKASRIIAMDAMMTERTVEVIRKMREGMEGKELLSVNGYRNAEDQLYTLTYSETSMAKKMMEDISSGKKVVFISNSVAKVEQYAMAVSISYPSLRMATYTAKTDASMKKLHMSNINDVCKGLDVLMYSPTITAGVSIEIDHFDRVYSFFTNHSCDAIASIQMLGRVRSIRSKETVICFGTIPRRYPCSIEEIEEEFRASSTELFSDVSYLNLRVEEAVGEGSSSSSGRDNGGSSSSGTIISAERNEYYIMWLYNRLISNRSRTFFERYILEYIFSVGASIGYMEEEEDEGTTNIKACMQAAKEAAKDAEASAIALADDLAAIDVSAILSRDSSPTVEEQRSIEKYKLKRFYGVRDTDTESVRNLNGHDTRQCFINLKVLLSSATMHQAIDEFRVREAARVEELMEAGSLYDAYNLSNHREHRACLDIMDMLGISNITYPFSIGSDALFSIFSDDGNLSRLRASFSIFHRPTMSVLPLRNMDKEAGEKALKRMMRTTGDIIRSMYGYRLSKKGSHYVLDKTNPFIISRRRDPDETMYPQIEWDACYEAEA